MTWRKRLHGFIVGSPKNWYVLSEWEIALKWSDLSCTTVSWASWHWPSKRWKCHYFSVSSDRRKASVYTSWILIIQGKNCDFSRPPQASPKLSHLRITLYNLHRAQNITTWAGLKAQPVCLHIFPKVFRSFLSGNLKQPHEQRPACPHESSSFPTQSHWPLRLAPFPLRAAETCWKPCADCLGISNQPCPPRRHSKTEQWDNSGKFEICKSQHSGDNAKAIQNICTDSGQAGRSSNFEDLLSKPSKMKNKFHTPSCIHRTWPPHCDGNKSEAPSSPNQPSDCANKNWEPTRPQAGLPKSAKISITSKSSQKPLPKK